MSRIGRMPITVPTGVKVAIKEGEVTVTGPNGELHRRFSPDISITRQENALIVSRPSDSKRHRSLHGLTRSLLANMVEGVTRGFDKTLEIVGVGYRAEKTGDKLVFRLGFSHPVEVTPLPVSLSRWKGPIVSGFPGLIRNWSVRWPPKFGPFARRMSIRARVSDMPVRWFVLKRARL